MITALSTNNFELSNANRFFDSVSEAQDNYYMFLGDFLTHSNSTVQPLYDIVSNTFTWAYSNMILGKKVGTTDVSHVVDYIPWTSGTAYAMYDDIDPHLPSKQFFVITTEGSYAHFWKCLDNNLNGLSTVQPLFASGASTQFYRTSDGYLWKYMTSVSTSTGSKFQVGLDYFPIVANTSVESQAVPGGIYSFAITNPGTFYNNYVSGAMKIADIYVNGDRTSFNISNNVVNQTNGYYTNCVILMTSGLCQGQFRTISNYSSNAVGSVIQVANQFSGSIQNGDTYEITPLVHVTGDGTQTINCVARALVNALATNSIYRIEILEAGKNYRWAQANVLFNSAAMTIANTATIRPIMPPPGGHGANSMAELYCNKVVISSTFANTESSTIPDTNQFQQIGIVRNPVFANVQVTLSNLKGNFIPGETILQYIPHRLNSGCTIVQGNTVLSCNTADFATQINVGDYVYVTSDSFTPSQLVKVQGIGGNSSWINLASNATFSSSNAFVYYAEPVSNCVCITSSANNLSLGNTTATLANAATQIIGMSSGAVGYISSFSVSGVAKQYLTFINLYKYIATSTGGTFQEGETVLQGNNVGYLYSSSGSGTLSIYCSGTPFSINEQILGQSSHASATITTVYPPEIVYGSGDIEYIENISPVSRGNGQSETIQLVINF